MAVVNLLEDGAALAWSGCDEDVDGRELVRPKLGEHGAKIGECDGLWCA